jgi:hypothetical protein
VKSLQAFQKVNFTLILITVKEDLYTVLMAVKEISHYWIYGCQQYNAHSFKVF